MQLKNSDVTDVMRMARKYFVDLPAAAQLSGMSRPLDEGERRTLAFIHGAMNLLNRRGLLRGDLKLEDLSLEYELADSQVDSAEYETEAGAEKPKTFAKNFTGSGNP